MPVWKEASSRPSRIVSEASVLVAGGVTLRVAGQEVAFRPEADPVNYLSQVRIPTLMINGRYDMLNPLEDSIRPMFDLLGTPQEHKELLLFDTDHIPPRNEFIRGTLDWLDRYLGPVGSFESGDTSAWSSTRP